MRTWSAGAAGARGTAPKREYQGYLRGAGKATESSACCDRAITSAVIAVSATNAVSAAIEVSAVALRSRVSMSVVSVT